MFDPIEWPLFVRHVRSRPWRAPRYGVELIGLAVRRIAQRTRLRAQDDPHQGLKQRPDWLGPVAAAAPESSTLRLPALALGGTMPALPAPPALREDDPEATYQRHRWANCTAALGNEARARVALKEALEWIAQPPERTHPAWESYSCSERVVNLAVLLAAHPGLLSDTDTVGLHRFFGESGAWIDAHLEYYGPVRTNNHFLNNGRALLVAGCVTANPSWVTTGLEIVGRFAPELFPRDGCLREGSSHYQLVVASWLFDALAFARICVPTDSLAVLEDLAQEVGRACARFAASMPGMDVHIGDISPDAQPQLTLARLHLLYPERLKELAPAGRLGEWVFVRRTNASLLARVVAAWPDRYTTHSHADLGSFIWLREGRAVLADPGRQNYLTLPATQAQLGPEGHNGMLVNGVGAQAGSVLRTGLWYPRPFASATVDAQALEDGFIIEHDGFARLRGVGKHRREVRIVDNGVEVTDSLEGKGAAEVTLLWHFAPGYRESGQDRVVGTTGTVAIRVTGPGDAPASNWANYAYSAKYGQAEFARCLSLSWNVRLPCKIQTSFSFEPCAA